MKPDKMTSEKLDYEYNNLARVPEAPNYLKFWKESSKKTIAKGFGILDVPYGETLSEKLDIFPSKVPDENPAPVFIFLHGGYWRLLDKSDFSFLSENLTDKGAMVVIVNYGLCPAETVESISNQIARSCQWIYKNIAGYGGDRKRLIIGGHSAGGHLSALMLAKDWPKFDAELPPVIFKAGLSLSGLYDLLPVSKVPFLKSDLRLSEEDAEKLSPVNWPAPRSTPLYTLTGCEESSEFKRQNCLIQKKWGSIAVPLSEELEGLHHFSIVEKLNDPQHSIFRLALYLLGIGKNSLNASTDHKTDRYVYDLLPDKKFWPILKSDQSEQNFGERLNVAETLLNNAPGENVFIRTEETNITYAQARKTIAQIAEVLTEDFELVPGNRVLLRGNNCAMMAMLWLASVRSGLIAVTTMGMLRKKEIEPILEKCKPHLIFCEESLLEEVEKSATGNTPVLPFNTNNPDGIEQRLILKPGFKPACNTKSDEIALLAFTSGTTGLPKAVIHTHANVMAACYAWPYHVLKQQETDIIIGTPPLAFTFGLGGLLLFPMIVGASVYFPGKALTPEQMLETINRVKTTVIYTSPTYYQQLLTFIQKTPATSLRISVSAGEALNSLLRNRWKEATGLDMIDGIGATEMFHIFISSSGENIRPGAIGKAVPGYEVKITDQLGNVVPQGETGNLAVIGPTGCRYMDDARQSDYVKYAWNYPCDIFSQDKDGYLYYKSRSDDMIISSGYNITPVEVEEVLNAHPQVKECGVVGMPDDTRGHIVKAFVVLRKAVVKDGEKALVKELQDFVKQNSAPYKYPRAIVFLDELPKTNTGKLQRFALKQMK